MVSFKDKNQVKDLVLKELAQMEKKSPKFSLEVKRKAVDEFISGQRTAQQLADELGYKDANRIYAWKSLFEEKKKIEKREQRQKHGVSPEMLKRLEELESENEELKKSLGEKSLIIDLLKKLQMDSVYGKSVTGLTETIKQLDQSKRRVK